jgi:predicted Zn finger-like uncharacterized protein
VIAQCPQCATKVQIDDARVPDKPFRVRCPKCQALISLAGRAAADAAAPPPTEPQEAPPSAEEPGGRAPEPAGDPFATAAAVTRREKQASGENDALVALSGPAAAQVQAALEKIGYRVDVVEDVEEGARLLEQGVYELAATARETAPEGRPPTLSQRILRLPPEARRRVFVMLIGDEFRSGDGTQAWAAQADLVLAAADVHRCENLIRATIGERKRLYQPYLDARRRVEGD